MACIRCQGQYDLGWVQADREGQLNDPKYIEGLPDGHPLKMRENVGVFTLGCTRRQLLQFTSYFLRPLGENEFTPEHYHFVGDFADGLKDACDPDCPIDRIAGMGEAYAF
ncbi:hypothetical protein WJS89_08880 [Sphingomicrobium sp. XHP0235]|uniref:hypothetical protein n=1 Tax=Sphingomicrobium aquimarinum TaxID=3133971 RepID=UPI0031FEFB9F